LYYMWAITLLDNGNTKTSCVAILRHNPRKPELKGMSQSKARQCQFKCVHISFKLFTNGSNNLAEVSKVKPISMQGNGK